MAKQLTPEEDAALLNEVARHTQAQPLDEQVVRAQALMAAATITAGLATSYGIRSSATPDSMCKDLGHVFREMFKKSLFLLLFEGQEDKGTE